MSKDPDDQTLETSVQYDYRFNVDVTKTDAISTLCASIGCFMRKDALEPALKGDKYIVKRPTKVEEKDKGKDKQKEQGPQRLEEYINIIASKVSGYEGYTMLKAPPYKFQDDPVIGESTGFYIGNEVIATAGHCVFEALGAPAVKKDIAEYCFVFGFTKKTVEEGIAANNIFHIERVLFGQNEAFAADAVNRISVDRPDWALVRLKGVYWNQPFPPALKVKVPESSYKDYSGGDVWCAGHPWGTTLKLSHPAKGIVNTNFMPRNPCNNIFRHNLKLNPGNSGGPIFIDKEVVGIVASGRWPGMVQTVGFQRNELDGLDRKSLVPIKPPTEPKYFTNATRNELWYSLTLRTSQLFVIYGAADKNVLSGTLKLEVEVPSLHGQVQPGVVHIPLNSSGQYLNAPEAVFQVLFPGLMRWLPCDTNKISLTWVPEDRTAGPSRVPHTNPTGRGRAGADAQTPPLKLNLLTIGYYNTCGKGLNFSETGCVIYRTEGMSGITLSNGHEVKIDLPPWLGKDMKELLLTSAHMV